MTAPQDAHSYRIVGKEVVCPQRLHCPMS